MELRDEDRERLAAVRWLPSVGPFAAFGRSWTVQTDDPELAVLVSDLYGDVVSKAEGAGEHANFRVAVRDGGSRSLVARDDLYLGGGRTSSVTMGALVWGTNRWVLDEASHDHLLVHAGGVVREDGLALIFPAPSESGKSTLTTALLERGFAYLSDEAIELRPDGTVRGYAKPLSLDRGAWDVVAKQRPDPSSPGASYLERQWHVRASRISEVVSEARLGAVVFPRFEPAGHPSFVALGPGETLIEAIGSTFAPRGNSTVALHKVKALVDALKGVPAYRSVRGSLQAACDEIGQLATRLP